MSETSEHNIRDIDQSQWESQVINSEMPVLVYFWAEWCGPCKMLGPIVREIAEQYRSQLSVVKVDADTNPELVMKYGVMGIPTLLLIQGGEAIDRIVGFRPKDKILDSISVYV